MEQKLKLTVGIGASAGGLKVLKELVSTFPPETPMAFIIVQHLDPTHESVLTELLSKESTLSVHDAQNGQEIEAGHIYVIPPNTYLEVNDEKIKLIDPKHPHGFRKAVDHLFRSLANDCKNECAGVLLSGAGSDGTAGLRIIKAAGGLSLVQDPNTAEHPSMPQSAIEAHVVDKIVSIKEIYKILDSYVNHVLSFEGQGKERKPFIGIDNLEEITAILKEYAEFDLRQYKPATIQRRIARRMSLTETIRYSEYLQKLRSDEKEREQLTKDLLINITDFFRDPEAYEILEETVLPEIINKVSSEKDIRVWVPGCASGEEAYSIAILLLEVLDKLKKKNVVKIFATDIDEDAIKTARKGIYPASVAGEVPKKILDKYFVRYKNYYKIKGQVRDLISFATQNVATHPPFSHIHLVSCRNLLIYLKKEVQERVLDSFYFSLEGDSYLFLGSSESFGNRSHFFKPVSKKWRIYKKIPGLEEKRSYQTFHTGKRIKNNTDRPETFKVGKDRIAITRSERIRKSILKAVVPPMIVVNRDNHVLYYHGELKPYLIVPTGEPRHDITQLVLPELRSRLRSGLYKVKKSSEKLIFHCDISSESKQPHHKRTICLELIPLYDEHLMDETVGIVFKELDEADYEHIEGVTSADETHVSQNLELELAETREELQNTIEELETTTEELKASHEEALSTNEELQSANEELEASSEELRSLNEELSTVNSQLKEKIQQLQNANNDVENFFASTDLPTIFLNPVLEIQRYTPAAEQLLKMGPKDIGRPIYSLGRDLVDDDLAEECKRVLHNFQPIKKEKCSYDGRWYIRQITPYRTEERKIEGVVLVFQDVTEIKNLSHRAEGRERQQAVVAKLGMLALNGTDPKELMHQAVRQVAHVLNADYCKVLKYQPEQQNLLMVAGIGWQEGLVGKATVPDDRDSQAGYTLMANEPVIVKKLSEEKRFTGPDLLINHRVVSGMSCVINHSDPPFGVLGVHSTKHEKYTIDDANFLVSVANMLSTAVRTKEHQENLYNSEEQFRTMANAIPQLAWMTDETGYIFWYNQRWYDYTGTSLDAMKGWGWQKVHHPDHVDRVTEKFEKHLELKEEWEDIFPLRSASGDYRWFLSRAMPITNQEGTVIRWFGTNTDITEQRELEASLKDAVTRLEETDKRKNEFLAILGHELRNPLAVLKGSAEIVETGIAKSEDVIDTMSRSINTMTKLLDDLLDLSRVSRNKIRLQLELVNVSEILSSRLLTIHRQCDIKNQKLDLDIENDLYINADPARLEQIFLNLLSNACKYTPEGGQIKVKAWKKDKYVCIQVTDNGFGIQPDQLNSIFEPFYQITPEGTAASGLGIGLALVKNLVELHGGTISVDSGGLGKGTTFEICFHVANGSIQLNRSKEDKTQAEIPQDIVIVLVDDNPDILSTFSKLLEKHKCKVYSTDNGKDAVKLIQDKEPTVAFVDIGLPDMSGYEVARALRKSGYKNCLIAASGYSHKEAQEKAIEAGFNQHLSKPYSSKEIGHILIENNGN
ncbi:ATP-binding protein [Fulvivirga ulvae]|uniref:chemotaxis protein CheB n=1 Tax=Fulvivirga ulvae TaxID=2904245 RepID=UPI001F2786C6|nr:chemotaxis protein CheB [Fulvivirga ulvae]UII32252.1 ATP-binding protein [Fulvivirga ulvae]